MVCLKRTPLGDHMEETQNIEWIQELIRNEQQMENSGLVDFSPVINKDNLILSSSIEFLKELKTDFINNADIFNQLKGSTNGLIKVYGIAKTHADFMLFRNGYKLVFNMLNPGKIQITFHHLSSPFLNAHPATETNSAIPNGTIDAAWGAFNEVRWVSDKKPVSNSHLVKFYLRTFVQNSTK